jgi:hypothetical protein
MAEQTYRSPGFFEREIDATQRVASPSGTPAGLIGTAEKGPAFVPVTVGSMADYQTKFGGFDSMRPSPFAANEWLKNRNSLTFLRVLGAGSNSSITDINNTKTYGVVKNAGFVVSGSQTAGTNAGDGFVQYIVAEHAINPKSDNTFPVFDTRSIPDYLPGDTKVNLVRAMIMFASGSRGILTGSEVSINVSSLTGSGNVANSSDEFKLIISSSDSSFFKTDGLTGIKILTCSLNPHNSNYYGKVLNTDPHKFESEKHYLYADFAVDPEVASGSLGIGSDYKIAMVSGSNAVPSQVSSLNQNGSGIAVTCAELFGRFDTRYTTARTTNFISQPFGDKEYDLFHFESLSDGQYSNNKTKVSIANLKASTDPSDLYGIFEVQVRAFDDTDLNPRILETFPDCSLNPFSDRYIARIVGDRKVRFDFDAEIDAEKRLIVTGRYSNNSQYVRVVMTNEADTAAIPKNCLPFGFRGVPTLKTNESLTDLADITLSDSKGNVIGNKGARLVTGIVTSLTGSIVPPLPMRFKVTRGPLASESGSYVGTIGSTTRVDKRFYWGVQNTRLPSGSVQDPNIGSSLNPIIEAYSKFVGIEKLDTLITGSGADIFNDNKFTLARVALSASSPQDVTKTADEHMLYAAYLRDAVPSGPNYLVTDNAGMQRVTMATLVNSSSVVFNRFLPYNKFTNIMFGGFDGLNILDKQSYYMTDRASSVDTGGLAVSDINKLGLRVGTNGKQAGSGVSNNAIASFRNAIQIMTDPLTVETNLLSIPGIKDSFVTDYAIDMTKKYSLALYIMDIPAYGQTGGSSVRLFQDGLDPVGVRPDAVETAEQFDSRAIDNNYGAAYFPDVFITDPVSGKKCLNPASTAALGALGFNDRVTFPWFAPAGFNRAALGFVSNATVRLLQEDRDVLQDARINPIANFPVNSSSQMQYVIFGQKTLQQAQSALDRVNVRRLVLEVKRLVVNVANGLLFENNDETTRQRFVSAIVPRLATIASQQGIEQFRVICDESNNSPLDAEQNRMRGVINIVPTRVIEFVALDFIVTNSGVSFE